MLKFGRKTKGFLMVSAAVTAIVFILLAGSIVGLYSGMFSAQESSRIANMAQQYAEIDANTLTLLSYNELDTAAHGRTNIAGADGWQSEVMIGPEKTINGNKQRIGTVKIYKNGEAIARASLQVPLSTQGNKPGGVPIGTVIAWPFTSDPDTDQEKWLDCDGRIIDHVKYPKLAALATHTPNYAGVFLRGVGSQSSSHYGNVLHQSEALGVLQGDAIRNITGSILANGVEGWPILKGAFYKAAEAYQNGFGHSSGPVPQIDFSAERVVPVSSENRPVNKAVRYLIKAT